VNGTFGVGQAAGGIGGAGLFQRSARAQIHAVDIGRCLRGQHCEQRQSHGFEMNVS
jgi:hypothetical protein